MTSLDPARALQKRLKQLGDPATRAWWEAYLKSAVPFRGVPMDQIRAALRSWLEEDGAGALDPQRQKAIALTLLRERHGEDKLAAILLLHERLSVHLSAQDLPRFAALFDEGAIADWNTCDWFSVKVLHGLVARDRDGHSSARSLGAWSKAENLWRRRASCVALVNLARRGDQAFPGFTRLALSTCAAVVRSPDRFAQTAVGWLLRELSRADRPAVGAFVRRNMKLLSGEAVSRAVEKMLRDERRDLLRRHAALAQASRARRSHA